jgi:hypothetical protein
MKPSVTRSYVNGLIATRDDDELDWLSSAVCGCDQFDFQAPMYGLPKALFLFVESVSWFAQGLRSGMWTYFEAKSPMQQQEMLAALRDLAPAGFAEQYAIGMKVRTDAAQIAEVDEWLDQNDERNNAFLWQLLEQNREMIDALLP